MSGHKDITQSSEVNGSLRVVDFSSNQIESCQVGKFELSCVELVMLSYAKLVELDWIRSFQLDMASNKRDLVFSGMGLFK